MKKILLHLTFLFLGIAVTAQVAHYPNGFRKAELPEKLKNRGVKMPIKSKAAIVNSSSIQRQQPVSIPQNNAIVEVLIGATFYDLQTNGSISNHILMNNDGTISAVWNFSPNAIQTTTPPFPLRHSGYSYYDGSNWQFPPISLDTARTGFPNIVVTPSGKEMIISHASKFAAPGFPNDSNYISIMWRAMKGTLAWDTLIHPWGFNDCHALPKACGGLTNENVYLIFQGKSGITLHQTPPSSIEGYYGPIYFTRSLDGGLTWNSPIIIPHIDSTYYRNFTGDSYSIMAMGDTVAITFGNAFTDVGLLKSIDAGMTWTKKIIQLHPQPLYNISADSLTDINHDGIADTISSNGGDSKVLIDNNGMCHVWFSAFRYLNDVTGDSAYTAFSGTDNLFYWNESMPQNNGYVAIAGAQDFNGNGLLDFPVDTFINCFSPNPWGEYGGGLTQMPSAGINASGKIFLSYQTVVESPAADTNDFHALRRHVFMMTLTPVGGIYNPSAWTYPYDIIPNIASGAYGEQQEGVFACVSPKIIGNEASVIYQRDNAPGHGLAQTGSCDRLKNLGNSSDILVTVVDVNIVGTSSLNSGELFISQNYPNPTSGLTYFNIGLKKNADVKVDVRDIAGRVVYREAMGNYESGSHTLTLNLSKLSQGVYTCSITANGEKSTRKLVINK